MEATGDEGGVGAEELDVGVREVEFAYLATWRFVAFDIAIERGLVAFCDASTGIELDVRGVPVAGHVLLQITLVPVGGHVVENFADGGGFGIGVRRGGRSLLRGSSSDECDGENRC